MFQEALSESSSKPSSTAASAISALAAGAPPASRTSMSTTAFSRTLNAACGAVTFTLSSYSRRPTLISAMPSLNAGFARSTRPVGGGAFSAAPTGMRPRTASAETKTLGP